MDCMACKRTEYTSAQFCMKLSNLPNPLALPGVPEVARRSVHVFSGQMFDLPVVGAPLEDLGTALSLKDTVIAHLFGSVRVLAGHRGK
mmetsp:Transcript_24804/g.71157  ORF Transcript_24804/g.71157 Transcript_24804/m.71157 type:complete len:88 (-) Transcript_24804:504-767(-)